MKIDDVAAKVAPGLGMTANDLAKAVDAVFKEIKSTVATGEKIAVPGFGAFVLKTREAGEKVHPETGETRTVAAVSAISFKPSTGPSENKKAKKDKAAK